MTQDWVKLSALLARRLLGVRNSWIYSPSLAPQTPQVCPLIQPGIRIWGSNETSAGPITKTDFSVSRQPTMELPTLPSIHSNPGRPLSDRGWQQTERCLHPSVQCEQYLELIKFGLVPCYLFGLWVDLETEKVRQWIHGKDVDEEKKPVGCWYGRVLTGISIPFTISPTALPIWWMPTSLEIKTSQTTYSVDPEY